MNERRETGISGGTDETPLEDKPPSIEPSSTTPSGVNSGYRNSECDTRIPIWLLLRSKPSLIGHMPDNGLLHIRQH